MKVFKLIFFALLLNISAIACSTSPTRNTETTLGNVNNGINAQFNPVITNPSNSLNN